MPDRRASLGVFATLVAVAACSKNDSAPATSVDAGACTSSEFAGTPLGVHCNALVDGSGRTVLLHGVNARIGGIWDVALDGGRTPFLQVPPFTQDDANHIRATGFNALRLPLQWSGLEPTDGGGFVEAYLDRVAAVVAMCKSAGLLVLLDLHQDQYSKEFGGDGAPLWAIDPAPTKAFSSPLSDADTQLANAEAGSAFGTFFGSSAAGERLRQRFAAMAAHVATRFADEPTVFGIELYNEPLASDDDLVAFDQEVLPIVRAAAPTKLVLFEPNAVRNIVGKSPIATAPIGPGTVYAPHVYTLAFTGSQEDKENVTKDLLEPSNESARAEADGFRAPLVVTEFGFDSQVTSFANYIRWQYELEDQLLASSFYWVWKEYGTWGFYDIDAAGNATERPAVFAAHARVRLEAVAGRLVSVGYDSDAKRFEAVFLGDPAITEPNLVSVGATPGFAHVVATCDGKNVVVDPGPPLAIPCSGSGVHTIVLTPG